MNMGPGCGGHLPRGPPAPLTLWFSQDMAGTSEGPSHKPSSMLGSWLLPVTFKYCLSPYNTFPRMSSSKTEDSEADPLQEHSHRTHPEDLPRMCSRMYP